MEVTVFSEVTIDGKLTLGRGSCSKVLFDMLNQKDIEYIHEFRSNSDGILVGMNTIRMDNPSLTCRYGKHLKNPIRVIVTKSLDIPQQASVLMDEYPSVFLTVEENKDKAEYILKKKNKECLFCGQGKIDIKRALGVLESKWGIHKLMVEGGGEIIWSFMKMDMVDRIILIQLPIIAGGSDNISLVQGTGFRTIEDALRFELVRVEPEECCVVMEFRRKES